MNQVQMEQLREHIEKLETQVSKQILKVKELKDQRIEAEIETSRLESELDKLTRTGRQPLNKSGKGPRRDKGGKKDKLRENSFEADRDDEEDTNNSSMFVPEDDCASGRGRSTEVDTEYTGAVSPQTRDTVLE